MAKPKEARNKLFLEDWKRGLSTQSLAARYNLSIGGVKALKQRLRVKQAGQVKTKEKRDVSFKVTSASTQTSASTSTKRMTFWLPGEMIEELKELAIKEKRTASDIAREVLRKR